jgi:hypothetical protein
VSRHPTYHFVQKAIQRLIPTARSYLRKRSRSAFRLVALWLQTTTTSRNPTARCVLYRIEAFVAGQHFDDHHIDGYQSS